MAFNLRLPASMKVLVTGGSGVVGHSAVVALIKRGHTVRVLSRGAADDVKGSPPGVEAWPGDVQSPASVEGAADGCEAVLHLIGIVEERPPETTFERVNVDGTRVMVNEATRAGCRRFIYVSSLGADRGMSAYHRSKAQAEAIVQTFSGEWVIIRPGAVYGPGDETLSVLLRMVRTLPVVPSVGDGSQRLQPIWHADLAAGLAVAVDQPSIEGRVLEVGGREVETVKSLVERIQTLTGRKTPMLPVPDFLASFGLKVMSASGLSAPISESQLEMLREENLIAEGRPNALIEDLGVTPTPLDEGLRRFINEQEIQLPDEGVGTLQQKTFAVDVRPSTFDAAKLSAYLREHLLDLMPALIDSDPEHSNPSRIFEGATLTLALPLRGHVQVRVAEVSDGRITLMTLAGHPLAGTVRFVTLPIEGGVHFEIQVYDRPANVLDWMLMRPIGDRMQDASWQELAATVARVAGATDPEVTQTVRGLDENAAHKVEDWAKRLSLRAKRQDATADLNAAPEASG